MSQKGGQIAGGEEGVKLLKDLEAVIDLKNKTKIIAITDLRFVMIILPVSMLCFATVLPSYVKFVNLSLNKAVS